MTMAELLGFWAGCCVAAAVGPFVSVIVALLRDMLHDITKEDTWR